MSNIYNFSANCRIKFLILLCLPILFIMCDKPTEPKDTEAPKASIVYPANQAEIIQGTVVTIKTDVSDNEAIKEVGFYIDGELLFTEKAEPYQYGWETQEYLGSHTIKIKAFDKSDNVGESNVVSVKVVEPVINIISGYVKNSLNQPINGAVITIESTSNQIAKANLNTEELSNEKSTVVYNPNPGRISKLGVSFPKSKANDIKYEKPPKTIPKKLENINSTNNAEMVSSWSAETDEHGYFEIKDLQEANYSLLITANYYQDYSTTYTQTKGLVQKDVSLLAAELPRIYSLSLADGDYSITLNWNYGNSSTVKGYNVYEQHYLRYKNDYEEDQYYYYPHYSDWQKVNSDIIINKSITVPTEEYNGRYGFYVLPVNIDNIETPFSDDTNPSYIGLPINNLPLLTFSLTQSTKPVYIPDDTHEIALHMRYYYIAKSDLVTVQDWNVFASTDSIHWSKVSSHGLQDGSSSGYMRADHYGYTKTISLNQYKGKTLYFKTDPSSYQSQAIIENKVMDYNQDGSDFHHNSEPTASFTVTPESGTTETTFQFDASGSSDNEDVASSLQVRWDWENDGTWDTNYSTTKTASHQYSNEGTKTVKLEVKDTGGLTNSAIKQIIVSSSNSAPIASYSVTQTTGNTSTSFEFDASGSSDNEDPTSSLQVRWDWENDDTWDTGYSTTKTASHQYLSEGTKTVKLEVKDTGGLTNSTSNQIIVSDVGTLTDIDGNVYQTVKIGEQWWMAENLKVTHYRNGEAIPNVTGKSEWTNLTTGAWCSYNNDNGNIETYGLLYNWYTVNDSRNVAPEGWHVPTDEEWKELEMYLGMSQSDADDYGWRGTDEGGKLKETGTTHWSSPNTGATNESGFTALPGGYRGSSDGAYGYMGGYGRWWSATEYSTSIAWDRSLYFSYSDVFRGTYYKRRGFSVRLVRD